MIYCQFVVCISKYLQSDKIIDELLQFYINLNEVFLVSLLFS